MIVFVAIISNYHITAIGSSFTKYWDGVVPSKER